ncbi:MAG: hypothetical protein QOF72_905, partial [Blastocatellia bacterium]|nr:hypothetical protein [Blastocatellia bacterium]
MLLIDKLRFVGHNLRLSVLNPNVSLLEDRSMNPKRLSVVLAVL